MPKYGTEVRIKDDGKGAPTPEPMDLFVLNLGRSEPQPTKLKFFNDTQKTVHVALVDEGILDLKEFSIESNHDIPINVKKDCSKGKHSYSVHYANEAPPNEDPKIIIDPDTPG